MNCWWIANDTLPLLMKLGNSIRVICSSCTLLHLMSLSVILPRAPEFSMKARILRRLKERTEEVRGVFILLLFWIKWWVVLGFSTIRCYTASIFNSHWSIFALFQQLHLNQLIEYQATIHYFPVTKYLNSSNKMESKCPQD